MVLFTGFHVRINIIWYKLHVFIVVNSGVGRRKVGRDTGGFMLLACASLQSGICVIVGYGDGLF
jgi:hypothetical protein